MPEAWATDELLASAVERYAAGIAGFQMPAAYGVGRFDGDHLTLGHVNKLGKVRPLPAVILASICGYVSTSGSFPVSYEDLREATIQLAPAEAATHMPHPNLWTWRQLLADARPQSMFCAYFLADALDQPDWPGGDQFTYLARS
jgi:hypothetical protein